MNSAKNGDFASLLDDLFKVVEDNLAEAQAELDAQDQVSTATSISLDYLSVVNELHSGRISVTGHEASEHYRAANASIEEALGDMERRFAEIVPPPLEPEILPSIEPEDIAKELALKGVAASELARVRRAFAFDNHPDRVPAHMRDRAIIRMQVANMLIDEAQERKRR